MQLKNKLLLLNLTVIGVAALLLVLFVFFLVSHQMRQEMWGFLSDEFGEYSLKYKGSLDNLPGLKKEMQQHFTQARMAYPIVCRVYDESGRLAISVENVAGAPRTGTETVGQALAGEQLRYSLGEEGHGSTYWYTIKPLVSPSGKQFAFEMGLRVDRVQERIERLRNYLLVTVPGVLLISAAGARWVSRSSLKPFGRLLGRLQQIRSSSLDQRLPVTRSGDEIDRLARAVNEMLERVEQAFLLVREFTSDAAHELRTPLARLSLMLEKNLGRQMSLDEARGTLDEAYEQCRRLARLVDDLMLLARLDSGEVEGELVAVDLADILEDLNELWSTACEEKGINLQVSYDRPLSIYGRSGLLRRLLANLADNAFRYTPKDGSIQVRARASEKTVSLSVKDSGPGIPQKEIPKLFSRFYRVDCNRQVDTGGTGLGLSICQKIVQLHQGTLEVYSEQDEGTIFQVTLPKASLE